MIENLLKATLETIYMVFTSGLFAVILGLPLGIILYLTRKGGLTENNLIFSSLDFVINIFRSIPFIILLIILRPLSTLIVGRSIGPNAAIVALTIAAAPFIARLFESSFLKVDKGIIEAARSMGSTKYDIVKKVLLTESIPSLVSDITLTLINLVAYSAMAGSIGGGGLGNLAVRYGVHNYQISYLFFAVLIIILLVQLIQLIGSRLYKLLNKA